LRLPGPRFSVDRLRACGAVILLATPLAWGWHPVPTLGSLAEALAVACVAAMLVFAPPPVAVDWRRLWLGSGGVLGLLLLRCLMQPLFGESAYAGFWLGPFAVLAAAWLVCCYWDARTEHWLRVVAAAVLLAALLNALVGFLQYWRLASIIDFLGPHLVYWDRTDAVAHGNVAQRNVLASLCLLGIAASIYLFPKRTAPAIALEGFLAYVVALTASRTPLVILLVVLLLVLLRERRWRSPLVLWFFVPVLVAQIVAPLVNHGLFSLLELAPAESSVDRLSAHGLGMRLVYYRLAAEIGLQSWAWGLGWKSLPGAMVEQGYRQQLWGLDELPTHAHNVLLQLWVENGLLLALLASLYPIWLLLRRGFAGAREDYARLSLAVLVVHSWLEYPLWQPALLFLFVALIRTLECAGPAPRPAPGFARFGLRALAVVLALGAALTALQLIVLADSWKPMPEARPDISAARLALLRMNPVTEPYADWLALNLNTDTPAQRVVRLERLVRWLPDAMMLGLLADAYRGAGRVADAQRIELQREVVFGVKLDL
jgi:O-antigen ligase